MLTLAAWGSLLGVSMLHFFSESLFVLLFSSIIGLLGLFLYRKISIFLFAFSIGWAWAYYHVNHKIAQKKELKTEQGVIAGKIEGIPHIKGGNIQLDVLYPEGGPWKIRLYGKSFSPTVRPGDEIRVEATLDAPWGMTNPGGYDYQKQYFIDSIAAIGKIKKIVAYHPMAGFSLSRWRQRVAQRIETLLGNRPFIGIIQAMTVGIRHNMTSQQWQVFQATGTSHVVAISGLHIGLVALLWAKAIGFIVRRSSYLTHKMPAQYYEAIAAILGALFYSAMAGFSVPTQRACIMVMVAMIARLRQRRILSWQTLAFAWLIMGVIDPFAPLQNGFWLSFGCVAALMIGRSHYERASWYRRWFFPQWVVFIGLMPMSVLFFHQVTGLSCVANLFFLPIVSMVIVPACLLGLFGLSKGFWVAHYALTGAWPVLTYLASLEGGTVLLPEVSRAGWMIGGGAALLLLMPRGVPGRYLGWLGFFPLFFPRLSGIPEGQCRFALLDVGQGLAAVLQTRDHVLVYDAGPLYFSGEGAGQRVIKPFLQTMGTKKIDKIVISHADLDHRGGLAELLMFPHGEILSGEPERLHQGRDCQAGESWQWDGVHFAFLHPTPDEKNTLKKRNNLSCVLKITAGQHSVLLTGDIEELVEKALLSRAKTALRSDILVVPHHGSLTSSSAAFIEAVSAQYALFPVGKNNRYHFPRESVITRYKRAGALPLLTWERGAIIFHLGGEGALTAPLCWRDTLGYYWNRIEGARESI